MPGQGPQPAAVDVTHVIGDLLDVSDLEALAHLDRVRELGSFEQGFVGAGVEPGAAAPEPFDPQRVVLEVDAADVGCPGFAASSTPQLP
jgi:hypothetical protein